MQTIETIITVGVDGSIRIPSQPDLAPGQHRAVLVIEAIPYPIQRAKPPLKLALLDVGEWPEGFTARREELYGDDGR